MFSDRKQRSFIMQYAIRPRVNPMDLEAAPKYYASPAYGEEIDVRTLANEISKSCTLTPADIVAVIESFLEKLPFYLKNSNKVRLDRFGIFKLSFSSEGKEKADEVTAKDIKKLKVVFTPSVELKQQLADVSFTKK